jgi:succinoglycan biosynthesis transport protein ExoP
METTRTEQSGLREYLAVLRRRKLVILVPAVLAPVLVLLLSLAQKPLYQAKAEVLLRPAIVNQITGTPDPNQFTPPDRQAQTQALVARVPVVAERTLKDVGVKPAVSDFLAQSSVSVEPNADLLAFTVTDSNQGIAARLATAYATEFTNYRRELDTAAYERALKQVQRKLKANPTLVETNPALFKTLAAKAEQLQILADLQTSNASVVRTATSAKQVSPKPLRNTILALLVGIVIGIALALLWERFDTRVRTSEEIEERLGLPILARLPTPPRAQDGGAGLVMLNDPHGPVADDFRLLRARVELATLDRPAKTLMVSSAFEQEGKSTTAANLALALARAGKNVVLVDLDLHNPSLEGYFGIDSRPGLTDVALGDAGMSEAVVTVTIPKEGERSFGEENGHGRVAGVLRVIPTGPAPAGGGEFISSTALGTLLKGLAEDADVLLIDAPPLLMGGDAIALSTNVDGILVVARREVVRRPALTELRHVLNACPAAKLGVIVTAAEDRPSSASYYYHRRTRPVAAARATSTPMRTRDS